MNISFSFFLFFFSDMLRLDRNTPEAPAMNTRSRLHEVDEAAANDDFCSTCHGVGRFLCCEGCPKSFHFSCVDPPLDENSLPDGEWFCKECSSKRNPPKPFKRGLFSQLLFQLDKRNPIQFALPKKIKQRFEGVTSNEYGEYADSDMKIFKSTRSGFVEDQDPYKLTDKHGNPIFCYKCKKSSLSGGPIARCEYCSLNWHLDCLNPPLPTVKTIGTKWKCPNHADHVFKKKRRPKSYKIIDTSLRRGFSNDGNIEVLDSSDEEQNDLNARDVPLHDYFDTPTGVSAPVPQHLIKPLVQSGVVYRIPSEGVKLDFIQTVKELNDEAYQDSRNSDILLALDELATREQDIRDGVRNLCYLQVDQSQDVATATARHNLETLIDVALSTPKDTNLLISNNNGFNGNGSIHSKDSKELLHASIANSSGFGSSSPPLRSTGLSSSSSPSVSQRNVSPLPLYRTATSSRRASQIANNKIHAAAEEGRYNTRRSSLRNSMSNVDGGSAISSNDSSTSSSSNNSHNSGVHSRLRSAGPTGSIIPIGSSINGSGNVTDYSLSFDNDYISPEERTHLLAIQKLMKLKGKDALMDFLLPRAD